MLITLPNLYSLSHIKTIAIYSLDASLYQASVELEGKEFYVADANGKLLRSFSILGLQKQFQDVNYDNMVLRHMSAYDEMVGQANKTSGQNFLEVPLKDNGLY